MRKFVFGILLICLLSNVNCSFRVGPVYNDPDLQSGLAIDREKALEFSDKLAEDFIAGRNQEIYSKMTNLAQETYPPEEVEKSFGKMNDYFGKLVEVKFKTEEIGYWQFPDGTKKPMRKFFYSAKTDKAEMGKYFLEISVIFEDEKLKCASFMLKDYLGNPPDNLK